MSTFLCGFNKLRKFKYDGNEIFWKYYFAHFKMFKVISRGPDNTELISTYQSRNNPKYLSSLGQAIVEIARRVPDGLLVSDLKAHSHLSFSLAKIIINSIDSTVTRFEIN